MRDQAATGEVVELLQQLIRIPSINPREARPSGETGEKRLARFVIEWLQSRGVAAELVEKTPDRPNVIATLLSPADAYLLLEAHLDTVEVSNMTVSPFGGTIEKGSVVGRGSVDTKVSLAVYMHTLARLAARPPDERPLVQPMLLAAIDEEHSFLGVRQLLWELAERGTKAVGGIVGEPTEMRMGCYHKGVIRLCLTVTGRAGHSSTPEAAVNPIVLAASVITQLAEQNLVEVHHALGASTRSVTRISGGDGGNIIPGQVELELDIRTLPGQDPQDILDALRAELEIVAPGAVTLHVPHVIDWPLDGHSEDVVAHVVAEALEGHNLSADAVGLPYGTDASKISLCGIPTVVLGPGAITQAHTADEAIKIDQIDQLRAVIWDTVNNPGLATAAANPAVVPPELTEENQCD